MVTLPASHSLFFVFLVDEGKIAREIWLTERVIVCTRLQGSLFLRILLIRIGSMNP